MPETDGLAPDLARKVREYDADVAALLPDEESVALRDAYYRELSERRRAAEETKKAGEALSKSYGSQTLPLAHSFRRAQMLEDALGKAIHDPRAWAKKTATDYVNATEDPTREDVDRILTFGERLSTFQAKYLMNVDVSTEAIRRKEVEEAGFFKRVAMVGMAGLDEASKWSTLGLRDKIREDLSRPPVPFGGLITGKESREPGRDVVAEVAELRGAVAAEMPVATAVAETIGAVGAMGASVPMLAKAVARGLVRAGMNPQIAARIAGPLVLAAEGTAVTGDPEEGAVMGAFGAIAGPVARSLRKVGGEGWFSRGSAEALGFTTGSSLIGLVREGGIDLEVESANALAGFVLGAMSKRGTAISQRLVEEYTRSAKELTVDLLEADFARARMVDAVKRVSSESRPAGQSEKYYEAWDKKIQREAETVVDALLKKRETTLSVPAPRWTTREQSGIDPMLKGPEVPVEIAPLREPTLGPLEVATQPPVPPARTGGGIYLPSLLGGTTREVASGAAKIVGFPRRAAEAVATFADKAVRVAWEKTKAGIERLTGEPLPSVRFGKIGERIHRFTGEKQEAREVARFALKDLSVSDNGRPLTDAQKETVFRYFTGEGDRASVAKEVGEAYAKTVDEYRAQRTANQRTLMELGGLSKETYEKWEGRWLPRRFRVIEEGKEAGGGRAGVNQGRIFRRKTLSPEKRQELDEIRDPGPVVAHGLANQRTSIAAFKALRDFAADPKLSSETWRKGLDKDPLPNERWRYGDLAGKYVTPRIAREVKGLFGAKDGGILEKVGELLDGLLSDYKMLLTAGNPATHVRNIGGTVVFKELDHFSALDPSNLSHSLAGLKAMRAEKGATVDIGGTAMSARDLKLAALRERVLASDFISTEVMDLASTIARRAGDTWRSKVRNYLAEKGELLKRGKIASAIPGTEIASALYRLEDTVTKMGSFVKKLRSGMSAEQAGAAVRGAYQTFGEGVIPALYKRIGPLGRQIAPPFLSFPEQAARIFARAAIEKPVTTALVASALIEGSNAISRAAGLSEKDEENLRKILPPWMAPGPLRPAVKGDKNEGVYSIVDLSYTVPIGADIEATLRTLAGERDQRTPFGLSPGPLATAIYEWVAGKTLFTGKPYIPEGASEAETARLKRRQLGMTLIPGPFLPGGRTQTQLSEVAEEEKGLLRLSRFGGVTIRNVKVKEQAQARLRSLIAEQRRQVQRLEYLGRDKRMSEADKATERENLKSEIRARVVEIREVREALKRATE